MNKTKRILLTIFMCISLICFLFLASFVTYKNVYADNINVDLSNTDKCQKTIVSSTLTSEQYTNAVNGLTDTIYRNGSYFLFNETLTFNNQYLDNNSNYYFLYRGAFYYDKNQFSSYANAVTLFNQNIGSAYSIGKYKVFSFGGLDFYANLYLRNEGVWSTSSQWNNGQFFNGFFLFFDSSTLTYDNTQNTDNLKEFSVNTDTITISCDIKVNQTLVMFGVNFANVPMVNSYNTGSNAASYVDINFIDIYNIWNLSIQNKANNKFYNHINKITYTKLESDFAIDINFNVTNKYNFSTIYLALNTGMHADYPGTRKSTIISYFRFNFYNDLYNFYDVPNTNSLVKYSFSNDYTANLTNIDYQPPLHLWEGEIVKYDNTKFKFNGFIDNSLYFAYDGKINNSFIVNYVDSDNTYSQNLYRNNVEWYDVFGHLYNFLIYLIFDMPLISNITQPIYFIINSAIVTIGWVGGVVAGLGIFGAFALVYLLFTIIRRNM